ncbi:MAG: hypothetical protein AAF634_10045 [Bacteroidota bacterium]
MKKAFDKKLAKKIKDEVSEYSFAYENGAWERFSARKRKKKNRGFIWYWVGAASLLLLLLSISSRFNGEKQLINPPDQELTRTKDSSPIKRTTGVGNAVTNSHKNFNQNTTGSDALVGPVSDREQTHRSNTFNQKKDTEDLSVHPYNNTTKVVAVFGPVLLKDRFLTELPEQIAFSPKMLNSEQEFASLFSEEDKSDKNKKRYPVEVGVQFVPGYGLSNKSKKSLASTNIGGGINVDIPIKSSGFTINTGAIFNSLDLSNEQRFVAESAFSGEVETTTNKQSVNLLNLDIPFNLRYNSQSKKDQFYFQTGWSSYLTIQENIEISERITIEDNEFDILGNETENVEVIELFVSEETSKNTQTQLVPLGTINLSVGYRSRLSKGLLYEFQPFYKYPINSLTTEDIRVPTGGIAFKIIFSK